MKSINESISTPIIYECDVLVAGGGVAGISAAMAAGVSDSTGAILVKISISPSLNLSVFKNSLISVFILLLFSLFEEVVQFRVRYKTYKSLHLNT